MIPARTQSPDLHVIVVGIVMDISRENVDKSGQNPRFIVGLKIEAEIVNGQRVHDSKQILNFGIKEHELEALWPRGVKIGSRLGFEGRSIQLMNPQYQLSQIFDPE